MTKPDSQPGTPLDLAEIRKRLAHQQGEAYWRSLEQLAETRSFQEHLEAEFPVAAEWDPVSRRDFLRLMGASMALAGLTACTRQPPEKIVPYVRAPERVVPGEPLYFATALPFNGYGRGVLVESHMGRPTKVEGNPQHPDSLGASDIFMQASILSLYDPDRSQVVKHKGRISTWDAFFDAISDELNKQKAKQGAGLHILSEGVVSPTLAHQLQSLRTRFPQAKHFLYEPVARDAVYTGARMAFGEPVETLYRVDRADVILSLDADFLYQGPGSLRYAREFAQRRGSNATPATMNRLYVVESTPSVTGTAADHRLPLRSGEMRHLAVALARRLGIVVDAGAAVDRVEREHGAFVDALARDLQQHRGRSLVIAGEQQPPELHALAHVLNAALDSPGQTLRYAEPLASEPVDTVPSLTELTENLNAGEVDVLIVLGANPLYNAPVDAECAAAFEKAPFRVHLGLYEDETGAQCHWHIPAAHVLEAWSDVRAYDGTATIMQPLIAPLYGGKSPHDMLAVLLGEPDRTPYDAVRAYWARERGEESFEPFWRKAVHDGVVPHTGLPIKRPTLRADWASDFPAEAASEPGLELVFRPDPNIWDGRFGNNGWLQELPRPLTKLTWDNVALMSPATAQRLGLDLSLPEKAGPKFAPVVELRLAGRSIHAPVWVLPGHADDSVTVTLGYGRERVGRVGAGVGFDAYRLRTADALWTAPGLSVKATGELYPLATTQDHHSMQGRHLIRSGTVREFEKHPHFAHEAGHHGGKNTSLYSEYAYDGYAWGMAINLSACIGCNACITACQAENNIAVVGKQEVAKGREMHWIRVDRYFKGTLENPETVHQPVPCMHCENAPCELVCPVAATVHSSEGLNDMVYNRCIGTRYCSNNCPYKVRRFNFHQYSDRNTPSLKLQRNPDVTVRMRGVMEKCTYCVQRINQARIEAKKEDRSIRDGEILTACQQACPTQAIVFGDINDPESAVTKQKATPLNYGILTELNTRPRTTYLARLTNPHPDLEDSAHGHA